MSSDGAEAKGGQPLPGALPEFIRINRPAIIAEWESFARRLDPSGRMSPLRLRDHIQDLLHFIEDDMVSRQTDQEQIAKSKGDAPDVTGASKSAAEIHADLRLEDGFDIEEMVAEYRALRATIMKLWRRSRSGPWSEDQFDEVTRFNEAIDQATAEAVQRFSIGAAKTRDLFLGILGHDLRNPIAATLMGSQMLLRRGNLQPSQHGALVNISECAARANAILSDLFDLTRLQAGVTLPVNREPMDLALLAAQLIDEMRVLYPGRAIQLEESGDSTGRWDKSRLGQVISNLLTNALTYSPRDSAITVKVDGRSDIVELSVHNLGNPIPASDLPGIFDALVRRATHGDSDAQHLGLGLYIAKRIVAAKGGTLGVTSSAEEGTKFVARLPRNTA